MKKVFKILGILILIIFLALVIFNLFLKDSPALPPMFQSKEAKLKNRPTLYNLGVNFADYDPISGRAGDFVFGKRQFVEFGYLVENDRGKKILPSPTYFLPQGTPIMAVTSGTVTEVRSQSESNDSEVMTQPEGASAWRITYDHLQNVRFKKGDSFKAGEVVGEVALGYNTGSGNFTMAEITVFIDGIRAEEIENYCPFMLLDESIKQSYGQKITKLVKDWESYMGDPSIYDESAWVFPGCKSEMINEAEASSGSKNRGGT